MLIESLEGSLPQEKIHLNQPVESLNFNGDKIQIEAKGETYTAKHVVLALPPRVAAETIKFVPELQRSEIARLQATPTWMAGQAKFVAIYDEPYWRNKGFSGDAMSQRGPLAEIHDASPMQGGPYALFGFVGVPVDA